jgi:hypothetical protein
MALPFGGCNPGAVGRGAGRKAVGKPLGRNDEPVWLIHGRARSRAARLPAWHPGGRLGAHGRRRGRSASPVHNPRVALRAGHRPGCTQPYPSTSACLYSRWRGLAETALRPFKKNRFFPDRPVVVLRNRNERGGFA